MATRRRLMTKHTTLTTRKECGSPVKKKTSVYAGEDQYCPVEGAMTSLNKSFPQDQEAAVNKVTKKTFAKTDNTGKQRQTLSERVVNTMKPLEDAHMNTSDFKKGKGECPIEKTKGDQSCNRSDFSPILIDTPQEAEGGDITRDDMPRLEEEEQTSVEEMMCEEALAAALPPLIKGDFLVDRWPHLYNPSYSLDASMDEGQPWRGVRTRPPRPALPYGVVDIDTDVDIFHTNVYSRDVMEYLKLKEQECPRPTNFLDSSPEVTPKMRGVLMDWLVQVQDHEELDEETLHLCVALIDRYLECVQVTMPRLQLVGITCLLIATKFHERFAPEITTLCHLTADSFKPKQVIRYEMQVLMTLEFDLAIPVSVTFLRRYLQVHPEQQPREVTSLAYYILDLSLTSVKMATVPPSLLAASAIYLSRRLVLGSGQAWTPSLGHYTSFRNPSELCGVVNELANLVYKAPASKFQGARKKYNTEHHCFVSCSQITNPETVETHFLKEVTDV